MAWIQAWETGMRELGYEKARLDIITNYPNVMLSYTWVFDTDLFYEAWRTQDITVYNNHTAWDDAHQVFASVDHLRPRGVEASPMLRSIMDTMGRN
jgi:hypothetical protein